LFVTRGFFYTRGAFFLSGDRHYLDQPKTATYVLVRQSLLEHLDKEVLPFWVSTKVNDETFGGYLPFLDDNFRPLGKVEEHVIVQLRVLYVHAVAVSRSADLDLKAELLRQYQRKFAFLKRQYLDEKSGGFFDSSYDRRAGSIDFLKETRSQVHAINFLAEIYLIIGHKEALELAKAIFSLIDKSAHDNVYGGYREYYEIPFGHPRNKIKTLSVQMHMLLALTRLYQAAPARIYFDRFEEIFEILKVRFVIPGSKGNVYNALFYDWQEIPPNGKLETKTVYGHSAELIWYLLEGATVFNKDLQSLIPWLTRVTNALLETGVSRGGAVYFAGDYRGKAKETRIWWWAQAETMVALLRVYETTRDIQYWIAFEKVRLWTFRNIVPDHSGTWVAFTDSWGFRRAPIRAGGHWQSGFHVTRALLQCIQTFDRLNAHNEPYMVSR